MIIFKVLTENMDVPQCTKKCGGGYQYRTVLCLSGNKTGTKCNGETVLDPSQSCNTGPCDAGEC